MIDVDSPPDGNEAALAMLLQCVREVKETKVRHVSVVLVRGPSDVNARFCGIAGLEIAANWGADLLKEELRRVAQRRMFTGGNPEAPANRVVYNIAKMPVCFDFLGMLVDAEMTRIRCGAPAPLRVAWYWGQDGDATACLNTAQREQNFQGILRPLVRLIGAVEDQTALDGRHVDHCSVKPAVESYRRGETIPKFEAPMALREGIREFLLEECGKAPVTITLREADHTPHRNSNLAEWLKLAEWLESQGEKVIFVRDTAKSRETIAGFTTCHAASEDLVVRMALYQEAKANLFVCNGPAMLCVFSDKPWLIFNEVQPEGNYKANTPEGWFNCTGITPPEQWPWSRPDQRIIWQRDTFEVMRDAYLEYIAAPKQAAA